MQMEERMPRIPSINWTTPRVAALAGVSLLAGTALFGIANAQTPTPTPTTPSGTATPTRQARADEALSRFAGNLGVDVTRVRDALKQTAVQYVDEALAAGRITAEQATAAKERINSGDLGKLGFGLHGFDGPNLERRGPGALGGPRVLKAAVGVASEALAQFLGVTAEQLKTELDGQSLAQVAAAHGKSADQLKQHIVSTSEQRLNEAVAAGRIDQAHATQMLDALKANLDAMINQVHQPRAPRPAAGAEFFFEGPRFEGPGGAGFFFFEGPRLEGIGGMLPGGI
jgi:hypothetical protein